MTRILIALDDTDASAAAVSQAKRLFGAEADYLAINVFEAPMATFPTLRDTVTWGAVWRYDVFAATEEDAEAAREVAAEEALETAERAGLEPSRAIGQVGDPATAIIEAAHSHDVDVIVVGSHRRSWFSRLLDPSVAAEVVKRADIPVLVAKAVTTSAPS